MLWCQIGLHRIFELAGEASTGKLERQLVSYHLLIDNLGAAHQILDEMSFMQRNNKYSRYLAYCVALRSRNDADAQSCLNTITNGQGDDDKLLFACIGESIKYGKPLNTARLLQRLYDKHVQLPSTDVDLGALLKYIVKSLMEVIATQTAEQQLDLETLIRLCAVFRHLKRAHEKGIIGPVDHSSGKRLDLRWFEEQSFDIARTHIKTWPRRYTIDLLQYSIQICSAEHGTTAGVMFPDEREARLRNSSFMQAILYASKARDTTTTFSVEDLPETSYESKTKPKASECRLVLHRNVFNIFSAFNEQYQPQTLHKSAQTDEIQSQLHVLVPFAFEALLFMNASSYLLDCHPFDEVSVRQFLNTVNELEPPAATYVLLADTVLAFAGGDSSLCPQLNGLQIPSISAARLLGHIVGALRQVQAYDVEQAARWIRCIAQLLLEDVEKSLAKAVSQEKPKHDPSLAMLESMVQQAVDLAKSHNEGAVGYPFEEVEWLATKLFNMAIDFHAAEQQKVAEQWAAKAVEVADVTNTERGRRSSLAEVLRSKIGELGWNVTVHK